jgi:alpha-glucosidase
MDNSTPWWQSGVIYQVYPRSFQDTDADGIGDLAGIASRLPYLATLGVDALWISPFYPSPMADFGYDVADYCDVDPIFGTLADFDALIARAHGLNLKVILDFVPNHTSDRHPWFLESRSSLSDPHRDWYLWRDPKPPSLEDPAAPPETRYPNNWLSHFGGPAWTYHAPTGQFYMHSFLPEQPDLNWRNSKVRAAIFRAMLFWLDRGVDGFRMDVLWLLIKDNLFRDNPPNPDWHPGGSSYGQFLPLYTADRHETHQIVAQMRLLLDSYSDGPGSDRVLIGEIYLPIHELVRYYGSGVPEQELASLDLTGLSLSDPSQASSTHLRGAQLPFNFHLIQTPWNAPAIAHLIRDYEAALPAGAWPNWVLGNHDQSRLATRLGPPQARVAAMLLLTLRGTPTLYYGDELGMSDAVIPPALVQDPAEKNQPGIGMGRDPERTPMLWDATPNAGFTAAAAVPWLPISADFAHTSVAAEDTDPASMLTLYRSLLALRRAHPALHSGAISEVHPAEDQPSGVLSYIRTHPGERIRITLNLGAVPCPDALPPGRLLLSTDPGRRSSEAAAGNRTLGFGEAVATLLDA